MITTIKQLRLTQKATFRIISNFLDFYSMPIHTSIKDPCIQPIEIPSHFPSKNSKSRMPPLHIYHFRHHIRKEEKRPNQAMICDRTTEKDTSLHLRAL